MCPSTSSLPERHHVASTPFASTMVWAVPLPLPSNAKVAADDGHYHFVPIEVDRELGRVRVLAIGHVLPVLVREEGRTVEIEV